VRHSTVVCLLWLGACSGETAVAQIAAPGPPGPYVVDVRGAITGFPQDAAIFSPVPIGTSLPSLGTGIEFGAHVYPMGLGQMRLGIGVSALRLRGTTSPAAPDTGSASTSSSTSTVATAPDVDATLTTIAPQLSLNFGSAQGWSYVSAGVGRAHLRTGTSAFGGGQSGEAATVAQSVDSGSRTSINVGGGARWFAKTRLAFSFDLRLHVVAAANGGASAVAAPSMKLVVTSVGVSFR
jgi:hypothetical protein